MESVVTGHVEEKIVGWIASKDKFDLDTLTHGMKHREGASKTKRKPLRTIDESRAINVLCYMGHGTLVGLVLGLIDVCLELCLLLLA